MQRVQNTFAEFVAICVLCAPCFAQHTKSVPPEEAVQQLSDAPPPIYPPVAKAARLEGTVKLRIGIGLDGTVQSVSVISGHPLLVQAAVDAVRNWRYKPFVIDGIPTVVTTDVEVPFRLDKTNAQRSAEDNFQKNYWPVWNRAEKEYRDGDLDKARRDYNEAASIAETMPEKYLEYSEVLTRLGSIAVAQRKFEVAEGFYSRALKLREEHQKPREAEVGEANFDLGFAYFQQGDLENAKQYLQRAASILDERRADTENTRYIPEALRGYCRTSALAHVGLASIAARGGDSAGVKTNCAAARDAVKGAGVLLPERSITDACAKLDTAQQ